MAIYIEYEGIKGNVTAAGYKNHIEVSSLAFGVRCYEAFQWSLAT